MSNRKKTYDPDFEANPEFEQDPGFEKWISQMIRDEAAGSVKELDNEPNPDKFEPIVKEACERGLLKGD